MNYENYHTLSRLATYCILHTLNLHQTLVAMEAAEEVSESILLSVWTEILKPLWREKKTAAPKIYNGIFINYAFLFIYFLTSIFILLLLSLLLLTTSS